MTNVGQSQFVKNGQTIKVSGGSAAMAQGALALIGGPGVEAWPVATSDYAAQSSAGAIAPVANISSQALSGPFRQPVARDRLGNIYIGSVNGSGNAIIRKFSPQGVLLASNAIDATATSINGAHMFQLQNGSFCFVYARSSGALRFFIFDANLNTQSANSIATEYASGNVVYHAACPLSGGGFAVAYQTSAGTSITIAIYNNAGTQTNTRSVQTLAGTNAIEFIRMVQLVTSGNILIAFRGTMTAGGSAGTSFVIVTSNGAAVLGPSLITSVATAGLLEVSVLPGFFAIAVANGTNLICAVYNEAGAAQGSQYSVGNTLNSIVYPQTKLTNDGTQFWLIWQSSVGNGIYIVPIQTTGTSGTAAVGLGSASIAATTYAIDAEIINGQAVVLAASSTTDGQWIMAIGLPDASLGSYVAYVRTAPFAYGPAADTTGSNGPRLLSGGGGLYTGANPPNAQPAATPGCGDFAFIAVYDQQNTAGTFFGIWKLEPSAIIGLVQTAYPANSPGAEVVINPGPGEYPAQTFGGSYGIAFNHTSASPVGTSGSLYGRGVGLAGVSDTGLTAADRIGVIEDFAGPEANVPINAVLCDGSSYPITGAKSALFRKIGYTWGGSGANFNVPDLRGFVVAGADNMGGSNAGRLGGNTSTGGISGVAALGVTGGEKTHVQTTDELATHSHTLVGEWLAQGIAGDLAPYLHQANTIDTDTAGASAAANVTQPTAVVNKIIWFA